MKMKPEVERASEGVANGKIVDTLCFARQHPCLGQSQVCFGWIIL